MELKAKIAAAQEELKQQESMQIGRDNFVGTIRKFMEMQTLTPILLREMINRIDAYETKGVGKHRTQRIVIHYRFIDTFALAEERAKEGQGRIRCGMTRKSAPQDVRRKMRLNLRQISERMKKWRMFSVQAARRSSVISG